MFFFFLNIKLFFLNNKKNKLQLYKIEIITDIR